MLKVLIGLQSIGFSRFDNRIHHRAGLGSILARTKQPIFAANSKWPNGILDRVDVNKSSLSLLREEAEVNTQAFYECFSALKPISLR